MYHYTFIQHVYMETYGSSRVFVDGSARVLVDGSARVLIDGSARVLVDGLARVLGDGSARVHADGSARVLVDGFLINCRRYKHVIVEQHSTACVRHWRL